MPPGDPDPLLARADAVMEDSRRLRDETRDGLTRAHRLTRRLRANSERMRQILEGPPIARQPTMLPLPPLPSLNVMPAETLRRENAELEQAWERFRVTMQTPMSIVR